MPTERQCARKWSAYRVWCEWVRLVNEGTANETLKAAEAAYKENGKAAKAAKAA